MGTRYISWIMATNGLIALSVQAKFNKGPKCSDLDTPTIVDTQNYFRYCLFTSSIKLSAVGIFATRTSANVFLAAVAVVSPIQ